MCVFLSFFFFAVANDTEGRLQWNGVFVHLHFCLYHPLGSVACYVSGLPPDPFFSFFKIEDETSSSRIFSGIIHGYYGSQATVF